jgi:hypothetical protein
VCAGWRPAGGALRLSQPSSCAILSPSHTGKRLAEAHEAEVAAFADLFSAGDSSEGSDSYIALVSAHERSISAVKRAELKYARSTLGGDVNDTSGTEIRRLCLRATDARDAKACAHKALVDAETEAASISDNSVSASISDNLFYPTSRVEERRRQAANKAALVGDLGAKHHVASRAARGAEEALEVYVYVIYTHINDRS